MKIKIKSKKEIEDAAKNYGHKFYKTSHPDAMIEVYENFISGALWMQKDLLETASEGFEEYCYKNQIDDETHQFDIDEAKSLWQVAKLSNQKIIQEKDEEISFLKSANERLEEARVSHLTTCEEKDAEIEILRSKASHMSDVIDLKSKKITELEDSLKESLKLREKEIESNKSMASKYEKAVKDIKYLCDKFSILLLLGENKNKHKNIVKEIRNRHGISEE